ncbi:MAG: epimerase [Sphingobacteriales bacterium]|nr:MAG: epimerase [Sphingobacteriales bacterium]
MKQIRVIITGATGMVGEGVLLECLNDPRVSAVLSVSRKPGGKSHPKLKEYIVPDFLALKEDDENLAGYDACFFCAGVSSIGMDEDKYTRLTYDTTIHFAQVVAAQNRAMVFTYVSGAGTDSTEKGRSMWARVKGRTENKLTTLPFKKAYNFRPAMIKPMQQQQYVLKAYKYFGWMYPIMHTLFPNTASTVTEIARAMIYCATTSTQKQIIEVSDIHRLAAKS